ncbi:hypothetical protein TRAPUB_3919 [Trametes pubescens]|uniref:Uncharacterized protein n=1 Tax=Trametes pubescens TaxID=154538 RepID=A0A1M2VCG7_TRAPU|nr:hypothetical protein TRAPUB_3919 [Trametes pubescens]
MDGILGASSPSRRVSFTTSSERDRPFVRPFVSKPKPVAIKSRATKKVSSTLTADPAPTTPENPRKRLDLAEGVDERVPALSQEPPRCPSTPVRPRTRSRSSSARAPVVHEKDADDVLPPSSPISSPLSSPLSSPVKDGDSREQERDSSLPPSSPIPIPRSPVQENERSMVEFDMTPSPPSPTLDALRITSRVSVWALLNPMPESPRPAAFKAVSPEPVVQIGTSREGSTVLVTDGDVTPLALGEAEADITIVAEVAEDHLPLQESVTESRPPSRLPSAASSRASTPELSIPRDIPSSPLSSPPRSVADDHDVAVDIDVDADIEDQLPPSSPMRMASPSPTINRAASRARSISVQRDDDAREPPRKKARHESSADASTSRVSPAPLPEVEMTPSVASGALEADTQNERKKTPAEDVKLRVSPAAQAQPEERQVHKPTQKRRRTVVWSDDESESDAPAPPPPPRPKVQKRKEQDGERKKTKKARTKETGAGDDVENEPLKGSAPTKKSKSRPPAKAGARSAAPTSATNIERTRGVSPDQHMDALSGDDEDEPQPLPESKPRQPAHKSKADRRSSSPSAPSPKPARKDEQEHDAPALPAYTLPLPAGELEGMLIETLATARASSLATSALYGVLMAARPALREMALPVRVGSESPSAEDAQAQTPALGEEGEKNLKSKGRRGAKADADAASKRAWVPAIEGVLEAGWRRCGVFGKVVNSGTDMGNQELALEARWFYDPERDEDGERAGLVRSMMRRPGKRSETKKAKQYYWRPLPKISRWDPEDDL